MLVMCVRINVLWYDCLWIEFVGIDLRRLINIFSYKKKDNTILLFLWLAQRADALDDLESLSMLSPDALIEMIVQVSIPPWNAFDYDPFVLSFFSSSD